MLNTVATNAKLEGIKMEEKLSSLVEIFLKK
jgi:hypothetical protein